MVLLFEALPPFAIVNILRDHQSGHAHHDIEVIKLSSIIDTQEDKEENCQVTSMKLKKE